MAAPKPDIDVSKLTPEEKTFYTRYGKLPPNKNSLLNQRLKSDRKYFDSGDYALSKVGKSSPNEVGSQHPSPERIPHSIPSVVKKSVADKLDAAGTEGHHADLNQEPAEEESEQQQQQAQTDVKHAEGKVPEKEDTQS